MPILKKVFLLVFLSLLSMNVSASNQLQLFGCDSCDIQQMQQIAALQAPLLQCEEGINPDTGAADSDQGENNATCYAPTKDLFVANPLTKKAFKYRVKADNLKMGEPGYVMSLSINADELEIIQTYYDLHQAFTTSIAELSTTPPASTLPKSGVKNHFEAFSNTSSGVSEACLNSAAAYLYSSEQNKNRLLDEMRTAIRAEMGRQTSRDFTSSLPSKGSVSAGSLTITAGTRPGVSGMASVAVEQQFIEYTSLITPVRASSCNGFGLWCKEGDVNNQIHYKVTYSGDITTKGINTLLPHFQLRTDISKIEGIRPSTLFGAAQVRIEDPASCLAQLIREVKPGDLSFVDLGPISSPATYNFGKGPASFCTQSKTVRTCTNTGAASACTDTTFLELTTCK